MTNKSAARPLGGSEANPKIDPAPNSNTEKEPDDWVTGAQASYLKTRSKDTASRTVFSRTSPRLKCQYGSTHSSRIEDRCNTGNPQ
jgi:hypothetical protein